MAEFDWVVIPEGDTIIGVPMTEEKAKTLPGDCPEYPQETIYLPSFCISKFPITVEMFRTYLEETSNRPKLQHPQFHGLGSLPVTDVTWHEAVEFCDWLSQKVNQEVRLPTAAEWQKAARGPSGRLYPYGHTFDPAKCNVRESGFGQLVPVDHFPDGASEYGVYDMSGNCWEWTMTIWRSRELNDDEEKLPTYAKYEDNTIKRGVKTICGGAYTTTERLSRATSQYLRVSDFTLNVQGFRVAYSLD